MDTCGMYTDFFNEFFNSWKLQSCFFNKNQNVLGFPTSWGKKVLKSLKLNTDLQKIVRKSLIFGSKFDFRGPFILEKIYHTEIVIDSLGSFLRLFGVSFRLPYLWYYLLSSQEGQKASRNPPGSCKKFQGRNPETISLLFWDKLIFHKDINWPLILSLSK